MNRTQLQRHICNWMPYDVEPYPAPEDFATDIIANSFTPDIIFSKHYAYLIVAINFDRWVYDAGDMFFTEEVLF